MSKETKLKKMHLHIKLRDEIIFNLTKIISDKKIEIPEALTKVMTQLYGDKKSG